MLIPKKPVTTKDKIITVRGKIFYNDQRRRIDLKKPIKDLFSKAHQRQHYTMEMCLSERRAHSRISELSKSHIIPVLLYFNEEEEEEYLEEEA